MMRGRESKYFLDGLLWGLHGLEVSDYPASEGAGVWLVNLMNACDATDDGYNGLIKNYLEERLGPMQDESLDRVLENIEQGYVAHHRINQDDFKNLLESANPELAIFRDKELKDREENQPIDLMSLFSGN